MHKLIILTKVICNFTQYSHDSILHEVIKLKLRMEALFMKLFMILCHILLTVYKYLGE